jgi:type I restriction enzyme S subunit
MTVDIASLVSDNLDIWTTAVERKSGAGRGGGKRVSLYGIGCLRALIIDLAVRGKLLPQNGEDEPASALIARSVAALHASIAQDTIRTPAKIQPSVAAEGTPTNWAPTRLGALVRVINGRAYKKQELLSVGTPVLRVGNLFTSNEWYYSNLDLEDDKFIDDGDLIYAWSASFGPFIWSGGRVIYHYHIWKLKPYSEPDVSRDFLRLFLQSETSAIKASGHGIAMLHMTKERMEQLPILLPPLAEQNRIVAKVDELMALCDALEAESAAAMAAHQALVEALLATLTASTDAADLATNWSRLEAQFDTLFTTEASVDALKQTVLDLAVKGRLAPQKNDDEDANVLLQRIQKERIKAIGAKQSAMVAASADNAFILPKGWAWAPLISLGLTMTGGTPKSAEPANFKGSIPFIGPGQISPAGEVLAAEKLISDVGLDQSTEALPGDVLMVCIGGSIGKSAIVVSRMAYNQQINAVRPILVESRYVDLYLRCSSFQAEVLDRATGSATPIINRSKWETIPVALPPLGEQRRIIAKADELMALCDALKARITDAAVTQKHLADAITERAAA